MEMYLVHEYDITFIFEHVLCKVNLFSGFFSGGVSGFFSGGVGAF